MAKDTEAPISPTVAAVFERFFAKLKEDGAGATVAEALKKALSAQNFDAESLRKAMFGTTNQND